LVLALLGLIISSGLFDLWAGLGAVSCANKLGGCINFTGYAFATPILLVLVVVPIIDIIDMFKSNKYFRIISTIITLPLMILFPIGTIMGVIFLWRIHYKKDR
jgi:hypothetical protein